MHFATLFLLLAAPLALAAPSPTVEDATPVAIEERAACPKGIQPGYRAKVIRKLKGSGVVPTLIPAFVPKVKVAPIKYGTKKVKLGTVFTTEETVNQPTLSFTALKGAPAGTNYSVFMIDPDVPDQTGPARMPFLHWYYAHAKPCGAGSPTTVTIYEPLTPASTTQHRYSFLVYREPEGYEPDTVGAQARPGFDVNSYAKKGKLELIGANFLHEAITNGVPS